MVFRSVESQVDVPLESSRMNPCEKHSKRAHSPVERVCHDLTSESAQQDKNELATFKLSGSHMHLRAIALGDSFVQSHPPIEGALALPSMSTITSKARNISRSCVIVCSRKIPTQISHCTCRCCSRAVSCNENCTLSTMK